MPIRDVTCVYPPPAGSGVMSQMEIAPRESRQSEQATGSMRPVVGGCEPLDVTFNAAFFEVSAQIIPVFFLALVLEEKLRPSKRDAPKDRVTHSWVLALLVAGEIVTLSVVAGGLRSSGPVGQFVGVCMLFPAFLIATPAIGNQIKKKAGRRERLGHASAGLAIIVTILGVLAALAIQNS